MEKTLENEIFADTVGNSYPGEMDEIFTNLDEHEELNFEEYEKFLDENNFKPAYHLHRFGHDGPVVGVTIGGVSEGRTNSR